MITRTKSVATLVLFAVWLDMSFMLPCVHAEEAKQLSEAEQQALRDEVKAMDDKAMAAVKKSEESGKKFMKTFQALQQKLDGMKAKIAADGDSADPALKESAATLEKDLKEMGVEYMKTVGTDELEASAKAPDARDLLSGCLVLSVKHFGPQRAATQSSLRKLDEHGDAIMMDAIIVDLAKDELWRMVGVCVNFFTMEDYQAFKAGTMEKMPDAYVDTAKAWAPESEQNFLELQAPVWKMLSGLSKELLKDLKGDAAPPPIGFGMLALVPMGLAVAFLFKLFRDMQSREEEKKAKKDKKDAKKSK